MKNKPEEMSKDQLAVDLAISKYCHIFYKGKVYRPAGFREPLIGEPYISKDGKVKVLLSELNRAPGNRTILREVKVYV